MKKNSKIVTLKNKDLWIKICINMFLLMLNIFAWIAYISWDKSNVLYQHMFSMGFDLAGLIGVYILSVVFSLDTVKPDKSTWLFFGLLVMDGIAIFLYILGWIVEGNPQYNTLNFITSMISFLCGPICIFIFWNYQEYMFPGTPQFSYRVTKILAVLMVLDIIFIIGNIPFRYLFDIDANGIYIFKWGYRFTFLYPFVALVTCIIANLMKKIIIRKRIPLMAFCITPIITSVTTVFFSEYSYNYVVICMVLMLLYGTIQMERSISLVEQSKELLEKNTEIMMSQIQPHFLYNTLNSISGLCDEDAKQAKRIVEDFANYLRMNMEAIYQSRMISFQKELQHTTTYLEIEKIRFGEDLKTEYDIQIIDFAIPPLTLQPIVENAVKHGICGLEDGGTIFISTQETEDAIIITIKDDGVGYDQAIEPSDERIHLGIENVRKRLQYMCNGTLQIHSNVGKGTTVSIYLPKERNV